MIIDANQINIYKKNLKKILPVAFKLYPNGIFSALDVEETDKDSLLQNLIDSGYIKNPSAAFYRNDNGSNLYRITGMIDSNKLDEAIELHNKLNPKIWDEDNNLIPEVKNKIEEIVDFFAEQLVEDEVKLIIDDIYIIGSNANFNYTDESDLDVHIIADQSFDCDAKHLDIIYKAYKSMFNKRYDIKINDVNVELYVENKNDLNNISAGVYSFNNGWIKSPTNFEMPQIDDAALDKLVGEWESKYLDIIDNPTLEAIDKYIDDIYLLRQEGLKEKHEFGLGNLTFKEIRRLGYLDNLKDLHDKLQGEALSL